MVSVMKLEKAPTKSYADIGGLEQQIQKIKESVELPLTHPELYEEIAVDKVHIFFQFNAEEARDALDLNNLLLKQEELQQLVANYIQYHITLGSPLFNITEDIQEAIFNFISRHPGLCQFVLSQLRIHYREFLGDDLIQYYLTEHPVPNLENIDCRMRLFKE
jgi:hypothetical protein